ncbi:MAG: heparan-alpha-glucosaminide N-acetyltransferase domain-containing protein [Candidatus Hydrogenedentales bacterium]|jgi:predicted acyltransferase
MSTPSSEVATNQIERMVSVDALRGFDMFWIIGAEGLVKALSKVSGDSAILKFVETQLKHVAWEGFHFEDLIFPLFVFLVGVSIVFSMGRIAEREGKGGAHKRIVRRGIKLHLLNVFYYGGFAKYPDPGLRYVGVLQRLAFSYIVGAILFCNLRLRGLIIAFFVIIIGYWALLTFIPATVPGHEVDPSTPHAAFAPGNNLTNYIDYRFLPGRRWDGEWDPEGLLSSIPAVGSCLLGIFAGMLLKAPSLRPNQKVLYLVAGGVAMIALGYLWSLQFPIIKKLWTSSYVLVAGGYSAMLLGFFYYVVDVRGFKKWATPFIWIGSNALTVYMACNLIDFDEIALRLVGGPIAEKLGAYGDLLTALVALSLAVGLTRWLYNRRIFIKV